MPKRLEEEAELARSFRHDEIAAATETLIAQESDLKTEDQIVNRKYLPTEANLTLRRFPAENQSGVTEIPNNCRIEKEYSETENKP